ncbi:MAG: ABC transporter ATP-binding protein [Bacteroidota bacterium]
MYFTGEIRTGTLSRDFERWLAKIRGKEDPYLTIDRSNSRVHYPTDPVFWALKDINFEINQGDVIGLVGENGAGKSTLLKILSRITQPTSGYITGNGRIISLLEIGSGFHPDLTGRQNIYLNGGMLGMRKTEISDQFDDILQFANMEQFIDTPVKRYSSGMYTRLAFSIACHLYSDIIIIDEILAVGDSAFQQSCLEKLKSLSEHEGKTIIMVSHNLENLKKICSREIQLSKGRILC